jgi:hypothetical protein
MIEGTFNLGASSVWAQSQTRKVILDADTTDAPVIINLPKIEDVIAVNGNGVQIVVNDAVGNAFVNNITIAPADGETIEGGSVVIATNSESAVIILGNDLTWVAM